MTIIWEWEVTIPKIDIRRLPYLKRAIFLSLPENYLDNLLVSEQTAKPKQNVYFVLSEIVGETNQYMKCVTIKFVIVLNDTDYDSASEETQAEIINSWKVRFLLELTNHKDYL
jgi:hypothetical protein